MEKKELLNRLKRARGQMDALIKMLEREEECSRVVVQFKALKAAIEGAFSKFLEYSLKRCLKKNDTEELFSILSLMCKTPLNPKEEDENGKEVSAT